MKTYVALVDNVRAMHIFQGLIQGSNLHESPFLIEI